MSALVPNVIPPYVVPAVYYVSLVLSAGALVLFALGIRRSGSVTARRPLGTGALLALAAVSVLSPVLGSILAPSTVQESGASAGWWWVVVNVDLALRVVLAVIAVVQIARAGAVPRPWNFAPLWALAAVIVAQVVAQGSSVSLSDQNAVVALFGAATLVQVGASVFLGLVAIVLALRQTRPDTVPVFGGRADSE